MLQVLQTDHLHCKNITIKSSLDFPESFSCITTIPALGHSYGAWSTTKAATCTTEGSQKRSCSRCGNTETSTLAALGHNYSSAWTTDVNPSCLSQGSKSHHCTRCGAKSSVTSIASLGGHDYRPTSAADSHNIGDTSGYASINLRCKDCGDTLNGARFNFNYTDSSKYTTCGYYCVGWSDLMSSISISGNKLRYPNEKFFVHSYAGGSWNQSNYDKVMSNLTSLWNNSRFYIAYDTRYYSMDSTNPWERALAYKQDAYQNAYWQ